MELVLENNEIHVRVPVIKTQNEYNCHPLQLLRKRNVIKPQKLNLYVGDNKGVADEYILLDQQLACRV